MTRKKHEEIIRVAPKIVERYLEVKNKRKVADEFGISIGGVDSALWHMGKKEFVSNWYRENKGEAKVPAPPPPPILPKEMTPEDVANALLIQATNALKEDATLRVIIKGLREDKLDLEKKLKEAVEEKDRILKIHNQVVKERGLPSIDEIIRHLRRDLKPGEKLT